MAASASIASTVPSHLAGGLTDLVGRWIFQSINIVEFHPSNWPPVSVGPFSVTAAPTGANTCRPRTLMLKIAVALGLIDFRRSAAVSDDFAHVAEEDRGQSCNLASLDPIAPI